MNILVTGGLGYIGSHTCIELLENNYNIVIIDNLCNSNIKCLERIQSIAMKKIKFYKGDVCNRDDLIRIFEENEIDAVIHFAGLKAVGESTQKPIEYYTNNIYGTLNLCNVMKQFGVKKMVFSSSATVYGTECTPPYTEDMITGGCTNPYGYSKYALEHILSDIAISDSEWSIVLLRYFNPLGSHKSGLIGENPKGIPNNLMPYITQVAVGKLKCLNIYGDDYDTKDGTCIRDYIHVLDLASGHVKAIENLKEGISVYNLGTGKGISVKEVVDTFSKVNNVQIPYVVVNRRKGDLVVSYADVYKAEIELGWKAKYSLEDMCVDSYNWQKNNPNGIE